MRIIFDAFGKFRKNTATVVHKQHFGTFHTVLFNHRLTFGVQIYHRHFQLFGYLFYYLWIFAVLIYKHTIFIKLTAHHGRNQQRIAAFRAGFVHKPNQVLTIQRLRRG